MTAISKSRVPVMAKELDKLVKEPPRTRTRDQPPSVPNGERLGRGCPGNLVRRRVLVIGPGWVGLGVVVRLAAAGLHCLTVIDFDLAERRQPGLAYRSHAPERRLAAEQGLRRRPLGTGRLRGSGLCSWAC